MLKKTVTYTDFNGTERTEDFYFNLTKSELLEMELSSRNGMSDVIVEMIKSDDYPTIMAVFKKLFLGSYGEKSPDGRRFIKSQELRDAFEQSAAYDELFMDITKSVDSLADFINSVIPKDIEEAAKKVNPEEYMKLKKVDE